MSTNPVPPREKRPDFVQSLARGLTVILAFGAERRELTLSEVARAAGLTRAAARRFLLTLVQLGYVESREGRFSLRPRVLDLGYAYLSGLDLLQLTHPHLERLAARTGASCSVSVLDDTEIVYLTPGRRTLTPHHPVGSRLPAYVTSMGRVLLSGLDDDEIEDRLARTVLEPRTRHTATDPARLIDAIRHARAYGYAVVDQELEDGVCAVAVPLRDRTGSVIAAINIVTSGGRVSGAVVKRDLLPLLRETAAAIDLARPG